MSDMMCTWPSGIHNVVNGSCTRCGDIPATETVFERDCGFCGGELTLEPDGGHLGIAPSGAGYVWTHVFTSDIGWFTLAACDGIQE